MTNKSQVSLTKRLINSSNGDLPRLPLLWNHARYFYPFCKTTPGTFTPFVKPRQLFSYLDVAIAKIYETRN